MKKFVPVTVVIPTYNRMKYLSRSIGSVLSQTYRPANIIVIDDGSTDDTATTVRQFEKHVKYVYQNNSGVSQARNRGIAEAKEEWIAFLDSDDEWYPHKLENQFEILCRYSHLKWSSENFHVSYGQTTRVNELCFRNRQELKRNGFFTRTFRAARRDTIFHTSGMLIHRSVLDQVGGFDSSLTQAEDNDLWWRIGLICPTLGYAEQPGHRYYQDTPGNLNGGPELTRMVFLALQKNLAQASAASPLVERDFLRLAHGTSFRRMISCYSNKSRISDEALEQHLNAFPLRRGDKLIFDVIKRLPLPLTHRLESYMRDFHRLLNQWI